MKRILIIIISVLVIFGCDSNQQQNVEQDIESDYIAIVDQDFIQTEEIEETASSDEDNTKAECSVPDFRDVSCGINDRGIQKQVCEDGLWTNVGDCFDPDICKDGERYVEEDVCGRNKRGDQEKVCREGKWYDATFCNDPDECTDNSTHVIENTCGLNGRGSQKQLCVKGKWTDDGSCMDEDICIDDTVETRMNSCGLNNNGSYDEKCMNGSWKSVSDCEDPDECTIGDEQFLVCGKNNRGKQKQVCIEGSWEIEVSCNDPDECKDNEYKDVENSCGFNNRGIEEYSCVEGHWVLIRCYDKDECQDDAKREGENECGINWRGSREYSCVDGHWVRTGDCVDPDVCRDTTHEYIYSVCGINGRGYKKKLCEAGQWKTLDECYDSDVCLDNQTEREYDEYSFGYKETYCNFGRWRERQTDTLIQKFDSISSNHNVVVGAAFLQMYYNHNIYVPVQSFSLEDQSLIGSILLTFQPQIPKLRSGAFQKNHTYTDVYANVNRLFMGGHVSSVAFHLYEIEEQSGYGWLGYSSKIMAVTVNNNNDDIACGKTTARFEDGKYIDATLDLSVEESEKERNFVMLNPGDEVNGEYTVTWTSDSVDKLTDIVTDNDNNIYVLGYTEGEFEDCINNGKNDLFISKFDAQGGMLWTKMYGSTEDDFASKILFTPSGDLIVAGETTGNIENRTFLDKKQIFLMSLDLDGNELDTLYLDFSNTGLLTFGDIVYDNEENLYIVGTIDGSFEDSTTFGNNDGFVIKLNKNGEMLHKKQFGTDGDEIIGGVTFDPMWSNIHIAGTSTKDNQNIIFLISADVENFE